MRAEKNLVYCFNELINNKSCYYYPNFATAEGYNEIDAKEFIQTYFNNGGKGTLFNDNIIPSVSTMRYEHMLFVYLLGILFYDNSYVIQE